ncbi:ABC transporter permease [Enterococcus sp. LJL99]
MNFIKRALCSVTRKKGKSLILFAVIFVLGNVIAGAIAIQQSTQNVEKNIKRELGGLATVEMDYENNQDEMMDPEFIPENLTPELINKIGNSPYVKYYDYNSLGWVQTEKLKSATIEQSEEEGGTFFSQDQFSLKGSNFNKILDIEEKKIQLVDGSVFTQEDIDKGTNNVLISAKVAETNGLSVGDQMIIDYCSFEYNSENEAKKLYSLDLPVKIIGIFEPTTVELKDKKKEQNEQEQMNQQFLSMEQMNTIYMTNQEVDDINKQIMEKDAKERSEDIGQMENTYVPTYVLNSPDDVDAFKQETEPLLPKMYKVRASTDQYDQVGGSMKKMAKISGYVVFIAVFAALLIISLVVLLFMRDRKHELGIYLSLGDKRSHVMGQIIIEMLLISGLALVLSLITGNFLGKAVSESLLNSDLLSTAQNQTDMMYYGISNTLGMNDLTSQEILSAYEVKFSLAYIISYLLVGLGTVLLSAVLPLVYIVRLNPKKIMM